MLLGFAVLGLLVFSRGGPEASLRKRRSGPVRVIRVEAVDVVPRTLGYGTAQPGQVWRAVSEVRGRVSEVHPQLESGAMVKEGEVLLRIDPTEYELAIAQFEADIAQVTAQLEELAVKEANDRASLEIEQASLALARTRPAAKRNAASNKMPLRRLKSTSRNEMSSPNARVSNIYRIL